MRRLFVRSNIKWLVIGLLILLAIVSSVWTSYKVLTLKTGQQVAVGPVTVTKPENNIARGYVDGDGNLIFVYTNGSTINAGIVKGKDGYNSDGFGPTDSQVSAAVTTYCATGQCNGTTPTPGQVATAISLYCASGSCKGIDGASVTPSMVIASVQAYCSNGACNGPAGPTGLTGADGKATIISCVIRTTDAVATQYVAWKYTDEADALYRDLYKLPAGTQGSNCVDLRAA